MDRYVSLADWGMNTRLGTIRATSSIVTTRSLSNSVAESADNEIGVLLKLVSRLSAVTTISSNPPSPASALGAAATASRAPVPHATAAANMPAAAHLTAVALSKFAFFIGIPRSSVLLVPVAMKRRQVLPFENLMIDHVLHRPRLAGQKMPQIVAQDGIRLSQVDVAHSTQHRSNDDLVFSPKGIFGRQGRFAKYVERGTGNSPIAQGVQQRTLVQHASSRHIDQEPAWFHGIDDAGVDETLGIGRIGYEKHEEVRLCGSGRQLRPSVHAVESGRNASGL